MNKKNKTKMWITMLYVSGKQRGGEEVIGD